MDTVEKPGPKKKKLLFIVIALLIVLVGLLLFLFLFSRKTAENGKPTPKTSTKAAAQPATTAPATVPDDLSLITAALVAKTGISASTIDVTLSQQTGNFAKGSVGTKGEETGGGYFLAAKVNGTWVIVYDGQASPDCSVVNPYNFPTSMVPECLDSSGNVVSR